MQECTRQARRSRSVRDALLLKATQARLTAGPRAERAGGKGAVQTGQYLLRSRAQLLFPSAQMMRCVRERARERACAVLFLFSAEREGRPLSASERGRVRVRVCACARERDLQADYSPQHKARFLHHLLLPLQ